MPGCRVRLDHESMAEIVAKAIDAATAPLHARIGALEARGAVKGEPGPAGPQGPPGEMGPRGEKGDPGERGERGEMGAVGAQGIPGRDGRDGAPGAAGEKGMDGKDGRDGLDGKDGRDGVDGLSFEDLTREQIDHRTFVLRAVRGDQTKDVGRFVMPSLIYRGVYEAGKSYQAGDATSWAGSWWIAEKDTTAKPGDANEASRAWRLAVKKGADGKPGPQGPEGPRGPKGDSGPQGPRGY